MLIDHEVFKKYKIIIWGHTYGTNTYSRIHYSFNRAFNYLGYDVKWLNNEIENLPNKNENIIFITEHQVDNIILNNLSKKWIVFDHNITKERYKEYNNKNIIPFFIHTFNIFHNIHDKNFDYESYRYYLDHPKIHWATDLLPNEIEFHPYNYENKDIIFIGSWWQSNFINIEKLRLWSIINGKKFIQMGKHLILRYKKYVPEEKVPIISRKAYIAPSIQGQYQCKVGYLPCRLLKNISYSVLGVSNNLFMANLFDDDEIIIDNNISKMMKKAEKVIKEKKVDEYTKKALKKVKEKHTYINRIEELFSYLK